MEGLQLFLLVLQIVIALVLIVLVLLQKSDGDSLSGISSATNLSSAISRRASASILSKITMTLIAVFMLNCLVLASISGKANKSIEQDLQQKAAQEHTGGEKPADAAAPQSEQNPATPAAPLVE